MVLATPEFLQPAFAQPVAVLGAGVSGEGVCALLAALGVEARVYDADPARGVEFTAAAARQHALAVFSPGFPPQHPWLERARAAGALCLGELDFAALFWRGRLVAITGTNGKTTLTEFITHALAGIGRAAYATGNIGHPLSRLVADQRGGARDMFAVCEVSSFQAETLRHLRADATLWTNFADDHLERHGDLAGYFAAKWRLVEHTRAPAPQDGAGAATVFAGSSVARFASAFGYPAGALAQVETAQPPPDPQLAGTPFATQPQRENFALAAAWWRANGFDDAALHEAARTFRLGRHRVERVAEVDGVTFWNDSKATNFHAVEAALAGFAAPVVLIAGGKSKGCDAGAFVRRIAPRVKHVVLIGETATELALHCARERVLHSRGASLADAVRRAAELALPGEHVLLSPGFASFDMFRNYEDRGRQFAACVRALRTTTPSLG